MRTKSRLLGSTAALLSLATVASMHAPATHAQEISPQIQWHACPPPPPDVPNLPLECGTLAVPLDYRAPHGETINIEISRLKSTRPELLRNALGRRSRLITVEQGGHTSYALSPVNACVNDAANAYLANGVFPPADRFCPAEKSNTELPGAAARERAETLMRKRVIR